MPRIYALPFLAVLIMLAAHQPATAQRDYFSDAEIELIRNNQEIDKRIDVLVHAIDRRFSVLNLDVSPPKRAVKNEEWGDLPVGTRLELLYDIKRILQKAIDDIDSLSERPSSAIIADPSDPSEKKSKGFEVLFPRAVRNLAAAASRYQPVLKRELDKTNSKSETGSIMDSLEMCDEILNALQKLPAEVKKPKN